MAIQFQDQSSNLKMVSNVLHLTVGASAGSSVTKSDARITSTMRVINIFFGSPENVQSDVHWTTSAGSIVFTATFANNGTSIGFDLAEAFT